MLSGTLIVYVNSDFELSRGVEIVVVVSGRGKFPDSNHQFDFVAQWAAMHAIRVV